MNSAQRTLHMYRALRQFSQSAARNTGVVEVPSSKFGKLKETQKRFGLEDGTPIYIKGGFADKLLYQTTVLLTVIGLAMSGQILFKLALK